MDKLTELVSAKSAMPAEWIQPSSEIVNLDIDSLDSVELIFEIESEFDIKIPTEWDGAYRLSWLHGLRFTERAWTPPTDTTQYSVNFVPPKQPKPKSEPE